MARRRFAVYLVAFLLLLGLGAWIAGNPGPSELRTDADASIAPDPTPAPVTPEQPSPTASRMPGLKTRSAILDVLVLDDASGAPVEGAELFCHLKRGALDQEGAYPVFGVGGAFRGSNRPVIQGNRVTNAQGRVTLQLSILERYVDGWIEVSVSAKGHVDDWKTRYGIHMPDEGQRREISFRIRPGRTLLGRVRGVDEDDREEIVVRIREGMEDGAWYTSESLDADGLFRADGVPQEIVTLRIKHPDYDPHTQDIVKGSQDLTCDITLRPRSDGERFAEVFLVVEDPPAQESFHHRIFIYSDETGDLKEQPSNSYKPDPTKVRLKMGTYWVLLATQEGPRWWALERFQVPEKGKLRVPLRLQAGAAATLTLRDAESGRILAESAGVSAVARLSVGGRHWLGAGGRAPGDEKKFLATGALGLPSIPIGSVRIEVNADGYESRSIERLVTDPKPFDLDVLLVKRK